MEELEIMLGWECNNNCLFCSNAKLKEIAREKGKEEIKLADVKCRITKNKKNSEEILMLVGGEPTIRNDIFEIINFARKKGYARISMMTNGRMLSNIDFCRKLLSNGLTDIGVSIHSHKAEIQDSLTRSPGSFRQTVKCLNNLNALGVRLVTNTVINKKNYKNLDKMVSFLARFKPEVITFTFPNPRGNAEKYFWEIIPKYKEVMPYVIKAIKKGRQLNQDVHISDIPICLMKGYKQNMQELFFDKERRIITHVFNDIIYTPYSGRDKSKHQYCNSCVSAGECEGVWTRYLEIYGDKEFRNVESSEKSKNF
mgnify:CR=1 FL=1